VTGEAWTIIVALATALQGVSIYLFKRVDNENKELKAELKTNNTASAANQVLNAELARLYIKSLSEKETE
jgi:hypothetical protein